MTNHHTSNSSFQLRTRITWSALDQTETADTFSLSSHTLQRHSSPRWEYSSDDEENKCQLTMWTNEPVWKCGGSSSRPATASTFSCSGLISSGKRCRPRCKSCLVKPQGCDLKPQTVTRCISRLHPAKHSGASSTRWCIHERKNIEPPSSAHIRSTILTSVLINFSWLWIKDNKEDQRYNRQQFAVSEVNKI